MNFEASTGWWILAGVLVAAELATGTFYLLMMALGGAAAAVAAHAGGGLSMQLVTAAAVGGGAVGLLTLRRQRQPAGLSQQNDPAMHLDLGQRVQVTQWSALGTTHVVYRGARWSARYAGIDAPGAGEHIISAIDGSELHLQRAEP